MYIIFCYDFFSMAKTILFFIYRISVLPKYHVYGTKITKKGWSALRPTIYEHALIHFATFKDFSSQHEELDLY